MAVSPIAKNPNRISAFYAAIALMIDKDITVRTHKGVQQKLGEEFVLRVISRKTWQKHILQE